MKFKSKGFTLIELLVVVAIISLLSSVVLAGVREARDKAKLATFVQEYKQLSLAVELYRSDYGGSYPERDDFFGSALTPYIGRFPEPPFPTVEGDVPITDYFLLNNKAYFLLMSGDGVCPGLSSKYDKLLQFGWQQITSDIVDYCTNGFMLEL